MAISSISEPIAIKFYLKHHLGGAKAALGFGPDRIRTLVSMVTYISRRFIMGESCRNSIRSAFHFDKDNRTILHEFEIRPDSTIDCGVGGP